MPGLVNLGTCVCGSEVRTYVWSTCGQLLYTLPSEEGRMNSEHIFRFINRHCGVFHGHPT